MRSLSMQENARIWCDDRGLYSWRKLLLVVGEAQNWVKEDESWPRGLSCQVGFLSWPINRESGNHGCNHMIFELECMNVLIAC
jgi:hypothetical protein